MGKAEEIIRRHVGNPAGLLGLLDDLVYAEAINWLADKLLEVYEEEAAACRTLNEGKTKQFALREVERLKALAIELHESASPHDGKAKAIIAGRYMINPKA